MNETQSLQAVRVLYADDVAANRRYIQALLEKLGLQTDLAEDGNTALRLWETQRHPLVLLDVHMPDLNGDEVASRIRALKQPTEDVIILGITADMNEDLRRQLIAAGMDDCMEKPTNTQMLVDALAPWIGASHPASEKDDQHQAMLLADSNLLEQLMRELPDEVSALETACKDGDLDKAKRLAHQLSGIAALYRLLRLRSALADLETQLKSAANTETVTLDAVLDGLAEDLVDIQIAAQ